MKKIISTNSIFLIGRIEELWLQLSAIEDKHITLAEYIKAQSDAYKSSLN